MRSARRLLRRKGRVEDGRFLAEGRQAVAEALRRPGTVTDLLVGDDVLARHADLVARAAVPVWRTPARVLAELSETVTPQGIVAICRPVDLALDEALGTAPQLVVVCDQIRDPGNLGAVIRCADAFGADAVLVTGDAVDLYNGKTVRASTGSLFHLPVAVASLESAVAAARARGLRVFGADGGAARTVDRLAAAGELSRPTMWVMGNEAWGLPPERAALLDELVALPMYGAAESLNLATAAAVMLYATATSQRTAPR